MTRNLSMVPTPEQMRVSVLTIQDVPVPEDQAFDELCDSVMLMGVLQPVVLIAPKTKKGKYGIVAGRRRCAACFKLGIEEIPALVFPKDTELAFIDIAAITENSVRSSNIGTDILAMKRLVDDGERDIKVLSRSTGLPEGKIKTLFELIDLPQPLVDGIVAGKVAPSTAKEVKKLKPQALTRALVTLAEKGNLSAKDVRVARETQIKDASEQIVLPAIPKLGAVPTPDTTQNFSPPVAGEMSVIFGNPDHGKTQVDMKAFISRDTVIDILKSGVSMSEKLDMIAECVGYVREPIEVPETAKVAETMAQRTKRMKQERDS